MRHKALILAFASLSGIAFSQTSGTPTSSLQAAAPAIDGILAAFQKAPLVGLGDWHGLAQEEDFYVSLVSDPRFATEVGNVVVEFGNASQQKVIDRYVDGEDIPYTELRKVWADTSYVGWFPTVTALGYLNFYAAIRAANAKLPAKSHIHIWLGGEPVDWSNLKTKQDLSKVVGDQPDRYPADLIEKEVLSKGKKALILYGAFHFYDKGSLAERISERHPGSLFLITPYTGFADRSCSEKFESVLKSRPVPALITASPSMKEQQTLGTSCRLLDASKFAEMTEAQRAKIRAEMEGQGSVLVGNSLLYLAPAESLTHSPLSPDLYLDPEFRKENERRAALSGSEHDPWPTVQDNPMSPQFLRDYGLRPSAAIQ